MPFAVRCESLSNSVAGSSVAPPPHEKRLGTIVVNQSEMLHQMCHEVLSQSDVKAICKARGLPPQAASSRGVLESLFESDTGLAAAFGSFEREEVALLHLLRAVDKPVDVTFFRRLDPTKTGRFRYGTFTQFYQSVFAKVKERLVRSGVLLQALGPDVIWSKKSQMERWMFALPAQFAPHLPPLIESPRRLAGEGDWRSDVARTKLKTAVSQSAKAEAEKEKLEIVDRELRWGGQPFRAEHLLNWQKRRWHAETFPKKQAEHKEPYALTPSDAVLHILGGLETGVWSDAEGLAVPLEIFCGAKTDGQAVCESGWRWGCLARQEVDGAVWYRVGPQFSAVRVGTESQPTEEDVPLHGYLDVTADGTTIVDLDAVPFESLEQLVAISDQRPAPSGRPGLLLTPNLIKLGRAADKVLPLPLVDWLQKNSPAFRQAIETLRQRRGKTILHENLAVARVSDLALKVTIEKALGDRLVALGEEYIAFPDALIDEVTRVVTKSGHVVKEVSNRES
jgi:hypothetical protein